jgi:uncharacterized membrane protein YccC
MKPCGYRALLLAGALAVCGYSQQKGVEPDWDIRPVLKEIAAHAQRLTPALEQIDAKGMVQNGAPETYASQINESKVQAKAVATEALALANSPEKLSADLETFFRLLSLEKTLLSVEEGLRKYWNPALADLLSSQMAQNSPNRERFQRYILDLAAEHEQEYAVMDHEAQRCRGALAKQPPNTEKK